MYLVYYDDKTVFISHGDGIHFKPLYHRKGSGFTYSEGGVKINGDLDEWIDSYNNSTLYGDYKVRKCDEAEFENLKVELL